MITPDASPLLSLHDPAATLATLERAFSAEGQPDESLVARELRVVGGGLDDGAHVELRARRLSPGALESAAGALDRAALLASVAPPETAGVPLALAHALEGVEGKIGRVVADELGIVPRGRQGSSGEGARPAACAALAGVLGLEAPPFGLSERVTVPRVAILDGAAWIVAPVGLASRPPPEQLTALARPLVRIALGVPWIDEIGGPDLHALLVAAARRGVRDYAASVRQPELDERIDEMVKRVSRALGPLAFKQKKALADLSERLASEPAIDARAVYAFALAVARTELRAAFLLSGDLLATLDAIRAADAPFARETERVGPRALAGTLVHPLGADVARFALSRAATAIRKRLHTTWDPASVLARRRGD